METKMLLSLLVLAANYGIPQVMNALLRLKKDEITLDDIKDLKIKGHLSDPFKD